MTRVGLVLLLVLTVPVQAGLRPGLFSDGLLQSSQLLGEQFPKQLLDPLGGSHVLPAPPSRIVSATLASDEMLAALGATQRVVGVTHLVDNPRLSNVPDVYPASVARVSGDIESILALQPDLVIVASYTRVETVRLLLGAGIPVLRLQAPLSLADLERNLTLLAHLTGHTETLAALVAGWQTVVPVNSSQPRVLYYDLSGSSVGPGDLTHELIERAGGYNVLRDTGLQGVQRLSAEQAISLQPDVILLSGWDIQAKADQQMYTNPAWQNVPAIKQRRVCVLQGAWRSSASHFRWQGFAQIQQCLMDREEQP
ncbi:ABC transporter substrate-binding protein [Pontibacter sp. JAM-7]|uniref:ABC transporter substrate-binding protein n=1 Tax=Pontibacter sp. JAM-7 TaxID=3366581 RepID=UPI003AF521D1